MMDDSLLKLELENLRELIRLKDLNTDLYEINNAILQRLSKYLEKHNDSLDLETINLLGRSNQIIRDIQTETTNRIFTKRRSTDDFTEPQLDMVKYG